MSSSAAATKGGAWGQQAGPDHTIAARWPALFTWPPPTARQAGKRGLYLGPSLPSLEFGSAILQGQGRWVSGGLQTVYSAYEIKIVVSILQMKTPRLGEIKGTVPKHTASYICASPTGLPRPLSSSHKGACFPQTNS